MVRVNADKIRARSAPGPRLKSHRQRPLADYSARRVGPTIEDVSERAEQKGQPITSFARQKRNEFRGEFEPQPLQAITNLSRRAHRSSASTPRAGCERHLSAVALYEFLNSS